MNCPVHGNKLKEIKIKLPNPKKYGKYGLVSAFCCYECKKAYVDIKGIEEEKLGKTISGYTVVNINRCRDMPEMIYALNSKSYKSLPTTCKKINHFVKRGKQYNLSIKYDPHKDIYFINETVLFSNLDTIKKLELNIAIKDDEIIDYKNLMPNEIYIMNKIELEELSRTKKIVNIPKVLGKDIKMHHIPLKYDVEKDIYFIENEAFVHYKSVIDKLSVKCSKLKLCELIDMSQYAILPKKIYVLEDKKLSNLSRKMKLVDIDKFTMNFKGNNVFIWIPMKREQKTGKYYINRKDYDSLRAELKIKCNLKVRLLKKQDVSELSISANESYLLPDEVVVTDKDNCPKCRCNMTVKTHFLNDSKEAVNLRLYYCNKCGGYYIHLIDFNNYKELYERYIKNITGVTEKDEKVFNEDLYINKTVWNLTYGHGVFVKIQGSTLFVDFGGNLHSFRFPECFKSATVKLSDKSLQDSMMRFINTNDSGTKISHVVKNNNDIVNIKNVKVKNTNTTDVRRIPGLVYQVQLIGSSNNHATKTHPVKDVVVKLAYKNPKSKTFDIVSIPMHYCSRCDKYFDMKQSFLQTLQKYNLDINYFAASFESETGHPIVFKQMDLREFSKLKLFGYSVGANGLSTGARHELLDFILKIHLMTASEIKSQLQFNIRFIGKKAHMDDAVGDWKMDIDYINEYIRTGKIHWKY